MSSGIFCEGVWLKVVMDDSERKSRVAGCLFGLALGDAFGAPTEFLSIDEIVRRGPVELTGDTFRVTDDTQMALAVGEALAEAVAARDLSPGSLERRLRAAFVEWLNSPDNDRAPGMTCLKACENLEAGLDWMEATISHSKGCGANMRVAAVGLLTSEDHGAGEDVRAAIAQFQAALTHAHPTALAASDLTAFTVARLAAGIELASLTEAVRNYAHSQREVYHADWLGELWRRPGVSSPEEFIARGWDECLSILDRLDEALAAPDRGADPCLWTGQGWVAEEAFATGLLCFLIYPDSPRRALRRAAVTSGDSDSIACLTGAFAGAHFGVDCWPADWLQKIEYRGRLASLANELSK
ncbi:MAG TPA: ADP-ribosylglycohydrolase family protein [Pyrinomonadaceae bacterium]|nr:ADP-ribosylglycohydrolase family protein [Pyrinomonadaceae bacterium]